MKRQKKSHIKYCIKKTATKAAVFLVKEIRTFVYIRCFLSLWYLFSCTGCIKKKKETPVIETMNIIPIVTIAEFFVIESFYANSSNNIGKIMPDLIP
jgi:hypothetical protein